MIFLTETKSKICFLYEGFNCTRKSGVKKSMGIRDIKGGGSPTLVDYPTQLTLMTWISTANTSEKYERTQQGNLLQMPF